MLFILLEQFLNDAGFAQPFAEKRNGGCIGNRYHYSKIVEFRERPPVLDLEFQLLITEVEQLLQNQYLEEDPRIYLFPPGIALCASGYCAVPESTGNITMDVTRIGSLIRLLIAKLLDLFLIIPKSTLAHLVIVMLRPMNLSSGFGSVQSQELFSKIPLSLESSL